jgi:proteasome lid subunit RPN8/RPN11
MDGGHRFALTDEGRLRGVTAIGRDLLEAVEAHAREAFPAECCGYLTDSRVVRCTNVAAGEPLVAGRTDETAFAIGGAELLAFARSFDGPEPARVLYHSHTNGQAYFSAMDRAHAGAYPVKHLVVGVTTAGVAEAALFDTDFVELARWC